MYHHDEDVTQAVMAWCLERGTNKTYRIVLSGYDEYLSLLKHEWTMKRWKTQGGYSNLGKGKNKNRDRETLYFSPYCFKNKVHKQMDIFGRGMAEKEKLDRE